MSPKPKKKTEPDKQLKLRKSMWWVVLIGLINIIVVLLGTGGIISDASVIIIIGVFSFFSTLALSSYFSNNDGLVKGEMRKAITTSLLMVYFAVLAMAVVEPGSSVLAQAMSLEEEAESASPKIFLLKDFSTLIAVVVGFYFGGRSAEEIIKTWRGKNQEETDSDEADPDEADPDEADPDEADPNNANPNEANGT